VEINATKVKNETKPESLLDLVLQPLIARPAKSAKLNGKIDNTENN
jgi:hypothetical protein